MLLRALLVLAYSIYGSPLTGEMPPPTPTPTFVPHACGHGPVMINKSLGQCCACPCTEASPSRVGDDRYEVGAKTCNLACCACSMVREEWTDWPECGGRFVPLFFVTDNLMVDTKNGAPTPAPKVLSGGR